MKKLPNVYSHLFPLNNFKTVKEYFEYFIFTKNIDDLDDRLFKSSERKEWLKDYPTLESFPKTLDYIDNETSIPLADVAKELEKVELYLPKNEVLFHSGNLPDGIRLSVNEEFKLKEIFSATLDPYIANVHDSDDNVYWFINIKSDSIRCLPVPDEHGEYEVIILDSPTAKIIDIKTQQRDSMWLGDVSCEPEMKTIVYIDLY